MTAPICFVDTETDGVHPGRKPWDIALIRRDEHGQHEVSFFVEIDLSTANLYGLRVGRFYERHPRGRWLANPWADESESPRRPIPGVLDSYLAAETIARMTHGAHLVGAVPNFDAEVFDRLLREHGLVPAWHYHLIDVETLTVGYLRANGATIAQPPWKSDDLMAVLNVEPPTEDERHTALGDARWAMRTYDAVMGGAR